MNNTEANEKTPLVAGDSSNSKRNTSKRKRPSLIEIVVFLYYFAHNGTTPLTEQFVYQIVSEDYNNKLVYWMEQTHGFSPFDIIGVGTDVQSGCNSNETTGPISQILDDLSQSKASTWLLYLKIASGVPAVFSTLLICTNGDVSGRKIGILLSSAGSSLKLLIFVLAFHLKGGMVWLIIGNVIEGLCGSYLTMLGSLFAYIADSVPTDKRMFRFVVLQALMTISSAFAQLTIGYLIKLSGYLLPFWIMAIIYVINVLFIVIFIPNVRPKTNGEIDDLVKPETAERHDEGSNIVVTFKRVIGAIHVFTFKTYRSTVETVKLNILYLSFVTYLFFVMGKGGIETLFKLSDPICWNSVYIGYYDGLSNVYHSICAIVGVVLLKKCMKDKTILLITYITLLISRVIYAFSVAGWMLYVSTFVDPFIALLPSMLRGLMSLLVLSCEQGALFAAVFSIECICDAFSPAIFNSIYSATVSKMQGLTFLVLAGVCGLSLMLFAIYYVIDSLYKPKNTLIEEREVEEENTIISNNSN